MSLFYGIKCCTIYVLCMYVCTMFTFNVHNTHSHRQTTKKRYVNWWCTRAHTVSILCVFVPAYLSVRFCMHDACDRIILLAKCFVYICCSFPFFFHLELKKEGEKNRTISTVCRRMHAIIYTCVHLFVCVCNVRFFFFYLYSLMMTTPTFKTPKQNISLKEIHCKLKRDVFFIFFFAFFRWKFLNIISLLI